MGKPRSLAGASPDAGNRRARGAKRPAESRLQPGLAAPQKRGGGLGLEVGWRGTEAAQLGKGALMFALAESYDLLAPREAAGLDGEGGAGSDANHLAIVQDTVGGVVPKRGFGAAQAAVAPFDVTERIDERSLGRVGGEILLVALGGEMGEILGGFVENDRGLGIDAELQGVEAGCGLALGGAWAGGFLCVKAAGCDLFLGCHKKILYLSVAGVVVRICEAISLNYLE